MKELTSLLRDRQIIKVALDVDSTIANVLTPMISGLNEIKGTNFTIADHTDWDFKNLGSDYMEMMPLYANVWKNKWQDIQFLGNAQQITELTKYYKVNILTTRSPTNEGLTGGTVDTMHEWIKLHGLSHLDVEICDPKQNKARDFDYNIYIDDSPRLAETIEKMEGKKMLLVTHPYNEYIKDSQKITRVSNVRHAVKLLIDAAHAHQPQRVKSP